MPKKFIYTPVKPFVKYQISRNVPIVTFKRLKTKHYNSLYWLAQACGWTVLFGLNVFVIYSTESEKLTSRSMLLLGLVTLTGFGISHLFRTVILRKQVIEKSLTHQLLLLFAVLVTGAIAQSMLQILLTVWVSHTPLEKELTISLTLVYIINWAIIYTVWLVLYMFYQVVQKQRSKVIQDLKLTALKNEIELTNLKSQLNPHFMFNSMNSIRALIDENPQKAKTAVTKLSALLRNSLQYSKRNYVRFSDEMELVNDYLFLEKMRFEERLDFKFEIDPRTMELNFPPFMLQTIVENAIKHGISSLPEGGSVTITTHRNDVYHEIEVVNSGKLIDAGPDQGIGLSNTAKRLRILYGPGARIELSEKDHFVHCKIFIPA